MNITPKTFRFATHNYIVNELGGSTLRGLESPWSWMASQPRLMGVERSKREAAETVGPFETAVSEVNGTAVPVFLCFFL